MRSDDYTGNATNVGLGFVSLTPQEKEIERLERKLAAAASRERELEAQLDDEGAKVRGLRAELGLVKARVAELERVLEECQQNQ